MPHFRALVSPLLVLSLLTSCAGEGCESSEAPIDPPTYYQDIAPVLSVNCAACHREGGMNPYMLFDDASFTQSMAGPIAAAIEEGSMPPFYAEESEQCPNPWGWKHDPRLSAGDSQLISDWAAAGGPIGDPSSAATVPLPPSTDLDGADLTLFPTTPWTTEPFGEVTDQFKCFSIDPGLSEEKWLEAFQVVPDNLAVVHHVLTGLDLSGASAALAGNDGVYDCFGGFGVDAQFIGGWVPGSSPIEFPKHSGLRVPPGARIVLQMHYHMASDPHDDATGISLRWSDTTPVREAYLGLFGNAGQAFGDGTGLQDGPNDVGGASFYIPAGATGHTETMSFEVPSLPERAQTFMVANHMHYVGTDMRLWIERGSQSPESGEACLLHTPSWDFDWQQFYFYDASNGSAPYIYPGDKLWMQCTFDNTLDNPGVLRALEEADLDSPQDVYLGDGSLSEMCIAVLGLVIDIPMVTEDESHSGTLDAEINVPSFSLQADCDGPASLSIDDNGSLNGVASCGFLWEGSLLTMQYAISGEVPDGTAGSGDIDVSIVGVNGGGTATWTGTIGYDSGSLDFEGQGNFSGIASTLSGTISVNRTK